MRPLRGMESPTKPSRQRDGSVNEAAKRERAAPNALRGMRPPTIQLRVTGPLTMPPRGAGPARIPQRVTGPPTMPPEE